MKVIIFGAGSTAGTYEDRGKGGGNVGSVGAFLRRLDTVHPRWRNRYPALARVVDDTDLLCEGDDGKPKELATPRLDQIWTRLDYFSKLSQALGSTEYGSAASDQMYRAVADAYGLEEEMRALPIGNASFTVEELVSELSAGDCIVSFNWDTTIEFVADQMHIEMVQVKESAQILHRRGGSVSLIKPHGSLSWRHAESGGLCNVRCDANGRPRLDPMKADQIDSTGGGGVVPLVLGAVPIKSELLKEVQARHARVFEVVAEQWGAFAAAVQRADDIIVAGYSFPPEDAYGRFLLREAARRRTSPEPPKIEYFELDKRTRKTKFDRAVQMIFGLTATAAYKGPVKPPPVTGHKDPH